MKRTIIYAVLLISIITGCKHLQPPIQQSGVYQLNKQMVSDGKKDTTYSRTQIKIYTANHFMYASLAPDSSVGFGVGAYKQHSASKITEENIYSSRLLDSAHSFTLLITRTDSGYTQVIPDMLLSNGIKYKMTEIYSRMPASDTSALDGLWKMSETYQVKGKDTIKQPTTQFKVFQGGHFMFVHRYPVDKTGTKFKNGFGYGSFSLKNDTLSEEDEISNHTVLLHRKFAIKINFNGRDEYSQVISSPNEQSIEIYKRLK